MIVDNKIVQVIRPDSLQDSFAESYEYFLLWVAPDGGVYSWLFEDFERKLKVKGVVVNTTSENINKLFESAKNTIKLTAEDLTLSEAGTIRTILRAKQIRRYYRSRAFEKLAINTDSFKIVQSGARYNLSFEIAERDENILK